MTTTPSLEFRTPGLRLDERSQDRMRRRLARTIDRLQVPIRRVSVRIRDLNGPRGGVDKSCAIELALPGLPGLRVEKRARTPREAFDRAAAALQRSLRRSLERAAPWVPRERAKRTPSQARKPAVAERSGAGRPADGSLIGRRVGRSAEQLRRVAERPEKLRRDVWVDTAQPGTSASDRRVGAGSTARRNTKLNLRGMTAMLEDSARSRPSRKSTRRSANRAKRDVSLRLRATTRAREGRARRGRGPGAKPR